MLQAPDGDGRGSQAVPLARLDSLCTGRHEASFPLGLLDRITIVSYIALTTDVGASPGVMKGVIWRIAPDVQIVDLSHDRGYVFIKSICITSRFGLLLLS
jgi:hypothetical protein